jgi:hypothetical protein
VIRTFGPSEAVLQKSIVDYLRVILPPSEYVIAACPNASVRTAGGRASNSVAGLLCGIPDLFIVGPEGRTCWLEVKTPRGKLSDAQENIRDRFMRMGVPYAVVRSLSDVKAAVEHWRLPSREVA